MTERKRAVAMIFIGVAILAAIILAASLPGLDFKSGQPFSLAKATPLPQLTGEASTPTGDVTLVFRGITAVLILLLVGYVAVHLFSPEGRKKLLIDLALIGFLYLFATLMNSYKPTNSTFQTYQIPQPTQPPPPAPGPLIVFSANPPAWVVILASLLIAVLVFLVTWWVLSRKGAAVPTIEPLDQLAQSAEEALDALRAGENLRNSVLRCYYEMSRTLAEQRGIQRGEAMTPLEFEAMLLEQGLPTHPVDQLTHLFEAVRYGDKQPGEKEENLAIDSLTAIVQACRGAA
jgi:hypothetical protein